MIDYNKAKQDALEIIKLRDLFKKEKKSQDVYAIELAGTIAEFWQHRIDSRAPDYLSEVIISACIELQDMPTVSIEEYELRDDLAWTSRFMMILSVDFCRTKSKIFEVIILSFVCAQIIDVDLLPIVTKRYMDYAKHYNAPHYE